MAAKKKNSKKITAQDSLELIALYQNATENVMYFKHRIFWSIAGFTAISIYLWDAIHAETTWLQAPFTDFALFYYLIVSIGFLYFNLDCFYKTQIHRQKIDRCQGLDSSLSGELKGRISGFGAVFLRARTGKSANFKFQDNHLVTYRDSGDRFLSVAISLHVIFMSLATIYLTTPTTFCNEYVLKQFENLDLNAFTLFIGAAYLLGAFVVYNSKNKKLEGEGV